MNGKLFLSFFLLTVVCIIIATWWITLKNRMFNPIVPASQSATPCGERLASKIDLGRIYADFPSATFKTEGDEVFIAARNIPASHMLGFDTKSDTLDTYIGFADKQPDWNNAQDFESKTISKLTLTEDKYSRVSLVPGEYWLWVDRGADVEIVTCK